MKNDIKNTKNHLFSCLLLLIALCMQCFGDNSNISSESVLHKTYWQNIKKAAKEDLIASGRNAIAVGTSPAYFHWQEWTITAVTLGATAIAFFDDQQVRDFFCAHQSSTAEHFFTPWVYYGSGFSVIGIGGGLYLTGLGFSQPWLRETGREALTSIALAGIITGVLKITFGRSRPYENDGSWDFDFPGTRGSAWSFPSGHTTVAFALSSVLASRISNPFATIGLYCMAALTASQRMYSDKHWLSDVILGASIGTAVGLIVAKKSIVYPEKIGLKSWEIVPEFTLSGAGIGLIKKF